jgi:tetratricopeptide (TPR) repeat protein
LAINHQYLGEFQESLDILWKALEVEKRVRGNSEHTIKLQLEIAGGLRMMDKSEEAEEQCEDALRFALEQYSPGHFCLFAVIDEMARIYQAQGRFREAEELCCHLMNLAKKLHNPGICDTTRWTRSAISILADSFIYRGKIKKAEELYIDAVETGRRTRGPEHPIVIRDIYQLAMVMKTQGRHDEALAMMTECARLDTKVNGRDHVSTVKSYESLEKWTSGKYVFPKGVFFFCLTSSCLRFIY